MIRSFVKDQSTMYKSKLYSGILQVHQAAPWLPPRFCVCIEYSLNVTHPARPITSLMLRCDDWSSPEPPPPPPPALSLDGWYRRNVIKRSNMTFALTALRLLNWRCPKQSGACVYARFLSPNNNNCGDDSVLWCVDLLAKLSKSEYGLYHKVSAACTGTRITLACLEKRQTRPTKENSVRCDWIVIVPQQTTFPN